MKTNKGLVVGYVSSFKVELLLTFLIALLANVVTILVPLSIGKYYELVFDFEVKKTALFDVLPSEYYETVPQFLVFFTLLLGLKLVLGFAQRYCIASLGERIVNQIRLHLFEHQLSLDMSVYDEKGIGKYLLRYSGDLKSIQNYLTRGIIGFVVDLFLLFIAIVSIGLINYYLALICLLTLPIIALPVYVLNSKLNGISAQRRNKRSNMLSFVNQRLIGILSVKGLNRHNPEYHKFEKRSQQLLDEGLKYHRLSSLIYVLIPVLLYGMLGLIMFFIYRLKQLGDEINQGEILAAFLLIVTMLPVFRRSLRVTVVWKLGNISLSKLVAVLNLPSNYNAIKDDLVFEEPVIELKKLSFCYGNNNVWENLSYRWNGTGIHLINGNMGSGKSSLIKLLMGLYYPTSGEIIIGKQTTEAVNEKSLRKNMSVVSSDFPLLGRTVFEAISYSRKTSKRKHVNKVLNDLQAFLPKENRLMLEDKIGYSSSKISKGQEMILLFARALLTNKPILLLDEPFKNMDAEMRSNCCQILQKLRSKKMILLFSKRETIKQLTLTSRYNLRGQNNKLLQLNRAV